MTEAEEFSAVVKYSFQHHDHKFKGSDFRKEYRVSGTELLTNEYQKAKRAFSNHEQCASGTQLADKAHNW
jgi:hypothetical protein